MDDTIVMHSGEDPMTSRQYLISFLIYVRASRNQRAGNGANLKLRPCRFWLPAQT